MSKCGKGAFGPAGRVFTILAPLVFAGPVLAAPQVAVSTKPLHSLVWAVMQGVGEPELIVKGAASPHTYALRPSDAELLERADIVFWTGRGFEMFLADALQTLSSQAEIVELAQVKGLDLLALRQGGAFEAHAHDDDRHDHDEHAHEGNAHDHHDDPDGHGGHAHADPEGHDHDAHDGHDHDEHAHEGHAHGAAGASDLHFWLDPDNAQVLVRAIAATLAAADPANAAAYQANAKAEIQDLERLEEEIEAVLAPIEHKPFIVFHDAYQYFERQFDLTVAGTITVSPDAMPGVARIAQLREKIAQLGATCVFAEPNFEPAIVGTIIEGTPAKAGVLDPAGSALSEGPDLYAQLLRNLAKDLVACLGERA